MLAGQLEEKVHMETLFLNAREELSRNREEMKAERDRAKQALLDREEELRRAKVAAKERADECSRWEGKARETEKEMLRVKVLWNQEAEKARKRQGREALLEEENRGQRQKLEECRGEVG